MFEFLFLLAIVIIVFSSLVPAKGLHIRFSLKSSTANKFVSRKSSRSGCNPKTTTVGAGMMVRR